MPMYTPPTNRTSADAHVLRVMAAQLGYKSSELAAMPQTTSVSRELRATDVDRSIIIDRLERHWAVKMPQSCYQTLGCFMHAAARALRIEDAPAPGAEDWV